MPATTPYTSATVQRLIQALATAIRARHPQPNSLIILGVANGGITLAQRLGHLLGTDRVGIVDISFHRDDLERNPIPKEYAPTHLPFDINGATLILVDDVLHSGRTIKAALDEVFDFGRPATVELAVLLDRGGRKLPIQADFVAQTVDLPPEQHVRVLLDSSPRKADKVLFLSKAPLV